jgi:AraC-like DNA-binding protein
MKIESSLSTVSFEQLSDLVTNTKVSPLELNTLASDGHVEIHNLAKGLQARCWSCNINEPLELFGEENKRNDPAYFTLAFFLNTKGFRFACRSACLPENISWDCIFFSDRSVCKILIAPGMKVDCLTISFSKQWFQQNVLQKTTAFQKIKETVYNSSCFPLLGSMTATDKNLVARLVEISGKDSLGSLNIKCGVLKLISDFFLKLKERDSITTNYSCVEESINKVENYLMSQLTGRLPKIKELGNQFSISSATLKRYFKKKFGENISSYFIRRKLEYARHLIEEKQTEMREAAYLLGYRNVNHFISIYKKYRNSIVPADLCSI